MAQLVNMLATKPDDLTFITEIHMEEGKHRTDVLSLFLSHTHTNFNKIHKEMSCGNDTIRYTFIFLLIELFLFNE